MEHVGAVEWWLPGTWGGCGGWGGELGRCKSKATNFQLEDE